MEKTTTTEKERKELIIVGVLLFFLIAYWYFAVFPKHQEHKETSGRSESALLMSVQELRAYKDFENISETEGASYLRSMQEYCMITHELYKQEKSNADAKES